MRQIICNNRKVKTKAFTLIELLAVIVILGVIALIVSPIVIGAIEKSEKAAFARSIDGIIESVRIDHGDDDFLAPREYYYEVSNLTLLTVQDKKRDEQISINGQIDGNGLIHVDGEGNIIIDKICNTKYCASGSEDDITITDNEDGTITDFDKNDPVITLNGKATVYVELNGTYKEEGTYEITYTTTHNEKTVSVTRTVVVLEMTPVITITEPDMNYVKIKDILINVSAVKPNTVTGFTVEIKKDGKSESKNIVTGLTKTMTLDSTGVYEVIVTVIDNNSHKNTVSKTYKIDTTGPVIMFNPETVTLETEEVNNYNLLTGVTVKDNVDGTIEVNTTSVKTTGSLLKIPNTYKITYTVRDKLGNESSKERTFVVKDLTKPVITITPNEQSTFVKTKTITISATDNIKLNSISYVLIKDGVRGTSTPINNGGTVTVNSTGNYQIEVTATDSSDNSATKTSGTYKIDTTVPTLTFNDVTLKVNEATGYNLMTGVSATDNSGVNPVVTYEGSLSATIGTQKVTYKATDQAGNVITKVRTFNVVEAEGPILNFSSISSNNLWIKAQNITVTATDNSNLSSFTYEVFKNGASQGVKNGTINGKSGSATVALSTTGTYSIKLTGSDQYGNSSSTTSGVYYIDAVSPTITNYWWGEVNTNVARLYISTTDDVGIARVQCPTSTTTGGYANWYWFNSTWDSGANAYRCDITPSTFGHYGQKYVTHIYIYDHASNGGLYTQAEVTIPTIDIANPTVTNLYAKGYVGGNTLFATLNDDHALAGYYVTNDANYSCAANAPASWNPISGTNYNLAVNVPAAGTYYVWVKDAVGKVSCSAKYLYVLGYSVSQSRTCLVPSAGLTDSGGALNFSITAICSCQSYGTCKDGWDYGTDTERATISMWTHGSTAATYTIQSFTQGSFRNLGILSETVWSAGTYTSGGSGYLNYWVGYGRTGNSTTDTAIITKVIADSTVIYNGGFVNY